MDSYNYEEVGAINKKEKCDESVLRQTLICSVAVMQYFIVGLCGGVTTVLIPQMRQEANSTHVIDDELASWLYSTCAFSTFPWIIILPIVTNNWGRKLPQIATSVCSALVFLIFYLSQNPYHVLIAQILVGFLNGGSLTYVILIVVDYTSPKYRGMFLTIKSASGYWGVWVANAIGTFFPWKYVAILGFICTAYTFTVLMWPESPIWLAKQGRLEECKISYFSIHGRNQKTENEVHNLILMALDGRSAKDISFVEMFRCRELYRPLSVCVVMIIQYNFSGKIVCSLYILDIFKSITKDETGAYTTMLILDGVTVAGMYFGSYLSKIIKRRTLYLSSSFMAVLFLFIISLYLFLVKHYVLDRDFYTIIVLLTLYSLSISCGPPILALSILGELIPPKFEANCYIISGLTFAICQSGLVKSVPFTMEVFDVHGTFLFYGIGCLLGTIYLYFYLPETKNKTQQEIVGLFCDDKKVDEECEPL